MAPAVILIGCLLATMSCLTTAQNNSSAPSNSSTSSPTTTSVHPPASFNITTTRPPFNSTTDRPVNSTTNQSFNSTTSPSINPPIGSCGNPNLCCSGLNNSCHRSNCYCDVACLRLRDCCPDFKPTCLTVNNSSNGTKPNNTLTLTGTCSEPTLCCSGTNYSCFRGCFCDEACKQLNDCCPDLNSTCIFNTTTAAPPVTSTTAPPFNSTTNRPVNSTTNPSFNSTTNPSFNPPIGSCGNPNLCCSGLNGSCRRSNCYCDVACLRFRDCCPDFKPTCLTVNNSSNGTKPNNTLTLTGTCSEPTLCCSGTNYNCFRGCFCDEACKQLNDCCPDLNSTCIFNTTTAAPPVTPTTALPIDVLTLLTNLEVEVLAEESSTEEERQAALREVGAMLESYLRANNTDIYSFEVTRIQPISPSPCD